MGNTCVGPNTRGNGFLQSVTAAVWRNRLPEDGQKNDTKNQPTDQSVQSSKQNTDKSATTTATEKAAIQNTAPPPVKISNDEPKPQPQVPQQNPNEANKAKKPSHMKRVSSAGLRAESVLGRKTGNLKEIYSLGRKLGQGQFGTTFLCIEKATGKEYACKSISKRKLTTEEDVEDVRREIRIMHHMAGHPNVIQIVEAYEDAVAVHVVMELCAGGELFDRIIQRGHYTEKKAAELTRIIVGVVEACHSLGVMHRDLKPENFLFIDHREDSPLKTIDFGLSMFFRPGVDFLQDFEL